MQDNLFQSPQEREKNASALFKKLGFGGGWFGTNSPKAINLMLEAGRVFDAQIFAGVDLEVAKNNAQDSFWRSASINSFKLTNTIAGFMEGIRKDVHKMDGETLGAIKQRVQDNLANNRLWDDSLSKVATNFLSPLVQARGQNPKSFGLGPKKKTNPNFSVQSPGPFQDENGILVKRDPFSGQTVDIVPKPYSPSSDLAKSIQKLFNNPETLSIGQLAVQTAREFGIDPGLFLKLIQAESNFNPNAVSSAGAQGLTQLMPGTAAGLGVTDSFDIVQNLRGGARYLAQQIRAFNGDVRLALAAYNAGPGAVRKHGGVPPFKETQAYIERILGPEPFQASDIDFLKPVNQFSSDTTFFSDEADEKQRIITGLLGLDKPSIKGSISDFILPRGADIFKTPKTRLLEPFGQTAYRKADKATKKKVDKLFEEIKVLEKKHELSQLGFSAGQDNTISIDGILTLPTSDIGKDKVETRDYFEWLHSVYKETESFLLREIEGKKAFGGDTTENERQLKIIQSRRPDLLATMNRAIFANPRATAEEKRAAEEAFLLEHPGRRIAFAIGKGVVLGVQGIVGFGESIVSEGPTVEQLRQARDPDGNFTNEVDPMLSTLIQSFARDIPSVHEENRLFADTIAEGLGTMIPSLAFAAATGGLSVELGLSAKAARWIAAGGEAVFDEAINAGLSYREALDSGFDPTSARKVATDVFQRGIVADLLLNRLGMFSDPVAKNAAVKWLKSSGAEALQEGIQEINQNIALGKPWDENVLEAALAGGVLGGTVGGSIAIFQENRRSVSPDPTMSPDEIILRLEERGVYASLDEIAEAIETHFPDQGTNLRLPRRAVATPRPWEGSRSLEALMNTEGDSLDVIMETLTQMGWRNIDTAEIQSFGEIKEGKFTLDRTAVKTEIDYRKLFEDNNTSYKLLVDSLLDPLVPQSLKDIKEKLGPNQDRLLQDPLFQEALAKREVNGKYTIGLSKNYTHLKGVDPQKGFNVLAKEAERFNQEPSVDSMGQLVSTALKMGPLNTWEKFLSWLGGVIDNLSKFLPQFKAMYDSTKERVSLRESGALNEEFVKDKLRERIEEVKAQSDSDEESIMAQSPRLALEFPITVTSFVDFFAKQTKFLENQLDAYDATYAPTLVFDREMSNTDKVRVMGALEIMFELYPEVAPMIKEVQVVTIEGGGMAGWSPLRSTLFIDPKVINNPLALQHILAHEFAHVRGIEGVSSRKGLLSYFLFNGGERSARLVDKGFSAGTVISDFKTQLDETPVLDVNKERVWRESAPGKLGPDQFGDIQESLLPGSFKIFKNNLEIQKSIDQVQFRFLDNVAPLKTIQDALELKFGELPTELKPEQQVMLGKRSREITRSIIEDGLRDATGKRVTLEALGVKPGLFEKIGNVPSLIEIADFIGGTIQGHEDFNFDWNNLNRHILWTPSRRDSTDQAREKNLKQSQFNEAEKMIKQFEAAIKIKYDIPLNLDIFESLKDLNKRTNGELDVVFERGSVDVLKLYSRFVDVAVRNHFTTQAYRAALKGYDSALADPELSSYYKEWFEPIDTLSTKLNSQQQELASEIWGLDRTADGFIWNVNINPDRTTVVGKVIKKTEVGHTEKGVFMIANIKEDKVDRFILVDKKPYLVRMDPFVFRSLEAIDPKGRPAFMRAITWFTKKLKSGLTGSILWSPIGFAKDAEAALSIAGIDPFRPVLRSILHLGNMKEAWSEKTKMSFDGEKITLKELSVAFSQSGGKNFDNYLRDLRPDDWYFNPLDREAQDTLTGTLLTGTLDSNRVSRFFKGILTKQVGRKSRKTSIVELSRAYGKAKEFIPSVAENFFRLRVFQQSLETDMDSFDKKNPKASEDERKAHLESIKLDAAIKAQNLMNFQRVGQLTSELGEIIPYLNAPWQGQDAFNISFKNAVKEPGKTGTLLGLKAAKWAIRGFVVYGVGKILESMALGDDEDYKALSEQVKDNNIILPFKFTDQNGKGWFIRIPVEEQFGAFYIAPIRRAMGDAFNDDIAIDGLQWSDFQELAEGIGAGFREIGGRSLGEHFDRAVFLEGEGEGALGALLGQGALVATPGVRFRDQTGPEDQSAFSPPSVPGFNPALFQGVQELTGTEINPTWYNRPFNRGDEGKIIEWLNKWHNNILGGDPSVAFTKAELDSLLGSYRVDTARLFGLIFEDDVDHKKWTDIAVRRFKAVNHGGGKRSGDGSFTIEDFNFSDDSGFTIDDNDGFIFND